jgi:site-specific recombinase XerD
LNGAVTQPQEVVGSNASDPVELLAPAIGLRGAAAAAEHYAAASRAAATWRGYESDWRIFTEWCASVGLVALPAEAMTVAMFLGAQANQGKAPATLSRRLAAIRLMHLGAKLPSPHGTVEVLEVMRGIQRRSTRRVSKKTAAVAEQIKKMVDVAAPSTLQGLRDRALLLVGFAGALRRAEFVAFDFEHLTEKPEGLLKILIAESKTDQVSVPGSSVAGDVGTASASTRI